jgi:alpha-tubulin suppressor-like RCC1 family protein
VPIVTGTWTTAAVGYYHSCGIRTDGSLWCWGANSVGELGTGQSSGSPVPAPVAPTMTWSSLAVSGNSASCAIRSDGTLWCWGYDSHGALGVADGLVRATPTQIGTSQWRQISMGASRTCGIQADGTLWCWGDNSLYGLGLGNPGPCLECRTPMQVGSDGDWVSVASGTQFTCATRTDHTLWCWGDIAIPGFPADHSHPIQIGTETSWDRVVAGDSHACATRRDQTTWCWGINLLDPALGAHIAPTQVPGSQLWTTLTAGEDDTCGIASDHTLWCWGSNTLGQLGLDDRWRDQPFRSQ